MSKKQEALWTGAFIGIVMISLSSSMTVQGLNNGIPIHIDALGGSATLSGILATVFSLAAGVGRLAGGMLSDQHGRRRIMLMGGAIFVPGVLLPILIPSVAALMLFRIIQGVGFSMVTTAAAAAAADVLPPSRLGEGIGYFGLGQSLAMALGPSLGLSLFALGSGTSLFGGLGLLTLLILVLAWFSNYEQGQTTSKGAAGTRRLLGSLIERTALLPAAMNLVYSVGAALNVAFVSLYAVHKGFEQPGIFFACAAAAMILTRLTIGRLIDRHKPLTILIPTQLIGILAFTLIALAPSAPVFYVAGFCYGLSFGVALPLLSTIAVSRAPRERWGAANATFYLSTDIGIGLGATFWGWLSDLTSFPVAFLGGAVCMALTAVIGMVYLRDSARKGVLSAKESVR